MTLNGDFYQVTEQLPAGDGMVYGFRIKLNPDHFIFKAHFPGYPVAPGVCLIQIVAELASMAEGRPLAIGQIKNVKFTGVVSPLYDNDLTFIFTGRMVNDDGNVKVQALLQATSNPEKVFSKFSLTLT